MSWVYMIKNKGNKLYIGVTEKPSSRLYYHNRKRGAEFTHNNPSYKIVFLEEYSNLAEARKREMLKLRFDSEASAHLPSC